MAKILLVDDDPSTIKIVSRQLQSVGHEIVSATNGREGLEKLKTLAFDVIITDIMMPEMDGRQLIEEIERIDSSVTVVVISGNAARLEEVSQLVRVDGAFQKPFVLQDFTDFLNVRDKVSGWQNI